MSLALKQSKARVGASTGGAFISRTQFQGDPGVFGFIKDAITGVAGVASRFLPGPLGAGAAAISRALSGGGPGGAAGSPASAFREVQQRPPITFGVGVNPPFGGPPGAGTTFFGPGSFPAGPAAGAQAVNGVCPTGHHMNKADYFLKDGTFVPKGTKCVKNRRRNPLNPRAASRAVSRLESAKKATRAIDRISIKCRRCNLVNCKCR